MRKANSKFTRSIFIAGLLCGDALAFTQSRDVKESSGPEFESIGDEGERLSDAQAAGEPINQDAAKYHFVHCMRNMDSSYDAYGDGINIGVWEKGLVLNTHLAFGGRIHLPPDQAAKFAEHATHVAGTIAAERVAHYEEAEGMAPRAQIHAYDFWNAFGEMEEFAKADRRNVITNHSYGEVISIGLRNDGEWGKYTRTAQSFDKVAWENPQLSIFKSAGNDQKGRLALEAASQEQHFLSRFDTLSPSATAKNVITLGNMVDLTPIAFLDEDLSCPVFPPGTIETVGSSSWGPTDDGRIKPDFVTNGLKLVSPSVPGEKGETEFVPNESILPVCSAPASVEDHQSCFKSLTGTSMATPVASGIAALLNEIAAKSSNRGRYLAGFEMKALLAHTAIGPTNKPTYQIGYGMIQAHQAARNITGWSKKLSTSNSNASGIGFTCVRLNNRESIEIPVNRFADGRIRVTAAWTDQPGRPKRNENDRSKVLVHDIDISLRTLDGNVARAEGGSVLGLPWTLNPDAPTADAVRAVNVRDNLERIDIARTDLIFDDQIGDTTGQLMLRIEKKSDRKSIDVALLTLGLAVESQEFVQRSCSP